MLCRVGNVIVTSQFQEPFFFLSFPLDTLQQNKQLPEIRRKIPMATEPSFPIVIRFPLLAKSGVPNPSPPAVACSEPGRMSGWLAHAHRSTCASGKPVRKRVHSSSCMSSGSTHIHAQSSICVSGRLVCGCRPAICTNRFPSPPPPPPPGRQAVKVGDCWTKLLNCLGFRIHIRTTKLWFVFAKALEIHWSDVV